MGLIDDLAVSSISEMHWKEEGKMDVRGTEEGREENITNKELKSPECKRSSENMLSRIKHIFLTENLCYLHISLIKLLSTFFKSHYFWLFIKDFLTLEKLIGGQLFQNFNLQVCAFFISVKDKNIGAHVKDRFVGTRITTKHIAWV